jgi:hypothetical protein
MVVTCPRADYLQGTSSHADKGCPEWSIEASMMEMGGPPPGLMVHFARPDGDGFLLFNVWRNESDMRPFYDDVVLPRLAEAGLQHEESKIFPVWVLARP